MEMNLLLHVLPGKIALGVFWFGVFFSYKFQPKSFCFSNDTSQTKLPQSSVKAEHRGTSNFQVCNHTESRQCLLDFSSRERGLSEPARARSPHSCGLARPLGGWPSLHWLLVAGPVPLTGAIWKLSELLNKMPPEGLCEPRAGSGYRQRDREQKHSEVSGRNKELSCNGRNTDRGLREEQGIPLLWRKYRLGSWGGTRSSHAMKEIQIGVLSPLPPRAGCRHMGCENRLVPPCILLHTD